MSAIDPTDLAGRVAASFGGPSRVDDVRVLPGGRSSLTFAATLTQPGRAVEGIVVKVAPPGLPPVRNRDVLRQARLLRSLAGVTDVAVPIVLAEDAGDPPLFVMQLVEGDSFEPVASDDVLPAPDVLEARALEAAAMLARLHGVPPHSIGLAGELVVTLAEEVDRWDRALGTVDDDLGFGHEAAADALRTAMPEPLPPVVAHGDWRLGNMLCEGRSVRAAIDWEIWSLADPRIDLAWFLAVSVREGNPFASRDAPGMPTRAELLAAYEDARGAAIDELAWFGALVDFKQAATIGLIAKHNRRQAEPNPTIAREERHVPHLIERARDRLVTAHG